MGVAKVGVQQVEVEAAAATLGVLAVQTGVAEAGVQLAEEEAVAAASEALAVQTGVAEAAAKRVEAEAAAKRVETEAAVMVAASRVVWTDKVGGREEAPTTGCTGQIGQACHCSPPGHCWIAADKFR